MNKRPIIKRIYSKNAVVTVKIDEAGEVHIRTRVKRHVGDILGRLFPNGPVNENSDHYRDLFIVK